MLCVPLRNRAVTQHVTVGINRMVRLLKQVVNEAAGGKNTGGVPSRVRRGFFELRTKLGKGHVLARRGWVGENVGIFNSRLEVADGALKHRNLRHRIPGGFELCADLLFEVGGVADAVD